MSKRSYAKFSSGATSAQKPSTFFYGGPNKQKQINEPQGQIPTFESLTKKRILNERRFFCNNSNNKWLAVGIIPATKILDEKAPGFYLDGFLCGEKCTPLPLGGAEGIAALFATIRQIPAFNNVPIIPTNIRDSENITMASVNFAPDVLKISNINLDEEEKPPSIYLAQSSMTILLQNERAIYAAIELMDAAKAEVEFEEMIESAIGNYTDFIAGGAFNNLFSIEMLTNFADFFNLCIDIKKKDAVMQAQIATAENEIEQTRAEVFENQMDQIERASVNSTDSVQPRAAKISKRK